MINRRNVHIRATFLFLFLFTAINVSYYVMPVHGASPRVKIDSYQVNLDQLVGVRIMVMNAEYVAGGSARIQFNGSAILAGGVNKGDFGEPVTNVNNAEGFVHIAVARPTRVARANATMAIISFKGLSLGQTELILNCTELTDENGSIIDLDSITDGSIQVIPEFGSLVASIVLLASTALLLFAKRRK